MSQPSDNNTKEFTDLRMSSLFDAVSAQRNSALNEVANLKAENAVFVAMLTRQQEKINELTLELAKKSKPAGDLPK